MKLNVETVGLGVPELVYHSKMKAAIVAEKWKLSIFKKILDSNKYEYSVSEGITDDIITLNVETDNIAALALIIEQVNIEAAKRKMH